MVEAPRLIGCPYPDDGARGRHLWTDEDQRKVQDNIILRERYQREADAEWKKVDDLSRRIRRASSECRRQVNNIILRESDDSEADTQWDKLENLSTRTRRARDAALHFTDLARVVEDWREVWQSSLPLMREITSLNEKLVDKQKRTCEDYNLHIHVEKETRPWLSN